MIFDSVRDLLKYCRENDIKNYSAKDISCPLQFAIWELEVLDNGQS